ncbi:luciferin sulfotransferase-like [Anopheles darlingi]|uniref:luciferin sulfotransferase-like n=1 Tax=Anopheles darlingi TaxID=43151 RepID=UPI00210029AE|nr:luciferin sulfotransferase-like [Anopheles darlingi]
MTFTYSPIVDPVFQSTCRDRNEEQYIIVQCNDYGDVPINLPGWKPEPICLTKHYPRVAESIKQMQVRPDDVWIVTYPKSGTTWTQELVWLVCHGLDYQKAQEISLEERFPFIELGGIRELPVTMNPLRDAFEMPSPRFIKSHLPPAFLPNALWTVQPKLVHVRRNPKSVAVSYYHHSVSLDCYRGTLENFVRSMMNELSYYSPYHRHLIEYSELRYPNMLSLCFEDMKRDLPETIRKVCQFFNKTDYSEAQLLQLAEHLSFDKMRENAAVNKRDWVAYNLRQTNRSDKLNDGNMQFIRRGEVDGWRNEMPKSLVEEFDGWVKRNIPDDKYSYLFE